MPAQLQLGQLAPFDFGRKQFGRVCADEIAGQQQSLHTQHRVCLDSKPGRLGALEPEFVGDKLADPGGAAGNHPGFRCEVGERKAFALRQRMIAANDDRQAVLEQNFLDEPRVIARAAEHRTDHDIELPPVQRLELAFKGIVADIDCQSGPHASEPGNSRADKGRHADGR